ncbi:hypothetical protein HDU84_003039 [Entophlyctis sp. JEL0112]|nr:hypothetical protein HDU84_003039 [Entophlyctis sp. JEL0112]
MDPSPPAPSAPIPFPAQLLRPASPAFVSKSSFSPPTSEPVRASAIFAKLQQDQTASVVNTVEPDPVGRLLKDSPKLKSSDAVAMLRSSRRAGRQSIDSDPGTSVVPGEHDNNDTLLASSPGADSLSRRPSLTLPVMKKNAEFHDLFKSIDDDEFLVDEYSCAWQRDILIQGKMYLSSNHICFYANIFGWAHSLTLDLGDVISIEKRSIGGIIPNSIEISTIVGQKHYFASFIARDSTHEALMKQWGNSSRSIKMKTFSKSKPPVSSALSKNAEDQDSFDTDSPVSSDDDLKAKSKVKPKKSLPDLAENGKSGSAGSTFGQLALSMIRGTTATTMVSRPESPSREDYVVGLGPIDRRLSTAHTEIKGLAELAGSGSLPASPVQSAGAISSDETSAKNAHVVHQKHIVVLPPSTLTNESIPGHPLYLPHPNGSFSPTFSSPAESPATSVIDLTPHIGNLEKKKRAAAAQSNTHIDLLPVQPTTDETLSLNGEGLANQAHSNGIRNAEETSSISGLSEPSGEALETALSDVESVVWKGSVKLTKETRRQAKSVTHSSDGIMDASNFDEDESRVFEELNEPEQNQKNPSTLLPSSPPSDPTKNPDECLENKPDVAKKCECATDHVRLTNVVKTIFPDATIPKVWNRLYSSPAAVSEFLRTCRNIIGDFQSSAWKNESDFPVQFTSDMASEKYAEAVESLPFDKATARLERRGEYVMPLEYAIGPRSTRCLVDELILACNEESLCILQRSATPDVPSGTSFLTKTRICWRRIAGKSIELEVSCEVEFFKSSWIQGMIQSGAIEGMKSYFKEFEVFAQKMLRLEETASSANPIRSSSTVASPISFRPLSASTASDLDIDFSKDPTFHPLQDELDIMSVQFQEKRRDSLVALLTLESVGKSARPSVRPMSLHMGLGSREFRRACAIVWNVVKSEREAWWAIIACVILQGFLSGFVAWLLWGRRATNEKDSTGNFVTEEALAAIVKRLVDDALRDHAFLPAGENGLD